jgi:hypothetical protein
VEVTLQDLGSIGEFIAAIATLITLIYLAAQIRQNTRSVRAASHQAWVAAIAQTSMPPHPGFGRINRLGVLDPSQLDPDELSQYVLFQLQIFFTFEALYFQFLNGAIDEDFWRTKVEYFRAILRTPGGRHVWDGAGRAFLDPRFRKEVEEHLLNQSAA